VARCLGSDRAAGQQTANLLPARCGPGANYVALAPSVEKVDKRAEYTNRVEGLTQWHALVFAITLPFSLTRR
jgi:hypothetical protein